MRILVLDRNNRSRSPILAAFLTARRPKWTVESAGVKGREGLMADLSVEEVMKKRRFDLSSHRTRRLENPDIDIHSFDLIVTLDIWSRDRMAFSNFEGRVIHLPFPSPYGKGGYFDNVADRLDAESVQLVRSLRSITQTRERPRLETRP